MSSYYALLRQAAEIQAPEIHSRHGGVIALSGERLYAMRADHACVDTWLAG